MQAILNVDQGSTSVWGRIPDRGTGYLKRELGYLWVSVYRRSRGRRGGGGGVAGGAGLLGLRGVQGGFPRLP